MREDLSLAPPISARQVKELLRPLWERLTVPWTFEFRTRDGVEINVEVLLLECEPDYLHVSVSGSSINCAPTCNWPVGFDFIVQRHQEGAPPTEA